MSRNEPELAFGDAPRDPEELEATAARAPAEIAAATTLGAVHLTVSDLAASLAFYREALGLELLERKEARAALGVGERRLLVLVEEAGARPSRGYTGLYHFALLLPQRSELARWLAHAARERVPLAGLSDHFVSEALYLSDPDGHGIELYWDRPREGLGRQGRCAHDDAAARRRQPPGRAGRSGVGRVRRPPLGDVDGPRRT